MCLSSIISEQKNTIRGGIKPALGWTPRGGSRDEVRSYKRERPLCGCLPSPPPPSSPSAISQTNHNEMLLSQPALSIANSEAVLLIKGATDSASGVYQRFSACMRRLHRASARELIRCLLSGFDKQQHERTRQGPHRARGTLPRNKLKGRGTKKTETISPSHEIGHGNEAGTPKSPASVSDGLKESVTT